MLITWKEWATAGEVSQSLGAGIDNTGGRREEEAGGVKEQIWRAVESHLCASTYPIVFQLFTS